MCSARVTFDGQHAVIWISNLRSSPTWFILLLWMEGLWIWSRKRWKPHKAIPHDISGMFPPWLESALFTCDFKGFFFVCEELWSKTNKSARMVSSLFGQPRPLSLTNVSPILTKLLTLTGNQVSSYRLATGGPRRRRWGGLKVRKRIMCWKELPELSMLK